MKKLCVYCGGSDQVEQIYFDHARELGTLMVENNFELVFGGGITGLMGMISQTVIDLKGKAYGFITKLLVDIEGYSPLLTEIQIVDTMYTRKQKMAEYSDAFIILPGGFGTLDELFEVITLKQLGIHNKPIYILNTNHYWDHLSKIIDNIISNNFAKTEHANYIKFFNNPIDLINHINVSR